MVKTTYFTRIIKQLCETSMRAIRDDAAKAEQDHKIPIRSIPARTRALLERHSQLATQATRLQKKIRAAGFEPSEEGDRMATVELSYQRREALRRVAHVRRTVRLGRVATLQAETELAVIGLPEREAAALVRKLKTDLQRV